jgi:hypothetical protein
VWKTGAKSLSSSLATANVSVLESGTHSLEIADDLPGAPAIQSEQSRRRSERSLRGRMQPVRGDLHAGSIVLLVALAVVHDRGHAQSAFVGSEAESRALYNLDTPFDRDFFLPDLLRVARDAKLLMWATGIGFDAAYPELKLKVKLNADGPRLYDSVRTTCMVEHVLANALQSDITRPHEARLQPAHRRQLARQVPAQLAGGRSHPPCRPSVPWRRGRGGGVLPGHRAGQEVLRRGVRLQWKWYRGSPAAVPQAQNDELTFFTDRPAGKSFAPTACSEIAAQQRLFNCQ